MSDNTKCYLNAPSVWGKYFKHWQELESLYQSSSVPETTQASPKPEIIPANERRRAPLPVKLAVESSWQAVQSAEVDPTSLKCVFVSGLGDTQLTDYMCKVLASDNKQLSPTKFHNSVHNASAGYWTISTHCMQAANSIAGFEESVPLALMEAMLQCRQENNPVLFTAYDAPVSAPMSPLFNNTEAFSASLVLSPQASAATVAEIDFSIVNKAGTWPPLEHKQNPYIEQLYRINPAAKILSLCELLLSKVTTGTREMPLSSGTSILFSITQGPIKPNE